MSRFTVDLNSSQTEAGKPLSDAPASVETPKKKRGIFVKILGVLGILLIAILLIGGIGGYFYWQSIKRTPQYSLALLVDAARRDDKQQVSQIVDTESVVNGFLPQITDKAIELYGRGLPKQTLAKVAQIAAPLMPSIKEKAREELPRLIRDKTKPVENVPYWMIALGASQAVEIQENGDTAQVKSKMPDRPLELMMKRDGERWKVVAVKDDVLSRRIAETVGQEIVALAAKGSLTKAGQQLGVEGLQDMIKQLEGVFK